MLLPKTQEPSIQTQVSVLRKMPWEDVHTNPHCPGHPLTLALCPLHLESGSMLEHASDSPRGLVAELHTPEFCIWQAWDKAWEFVGVFFLRFIFIYFFIFGCAGYSLLCRVSLVAESRGYSWWQCGLLIAVASLAVGHGLQALGLQ